MKKTEIGMAVARSVGLARSARAEGRRVACGAEILTRRDLIKLMALPIVSGAAGAMGATHRAAAKPSIAIIGAGIAGLNAAFTLQKAGYPSTVFEGANRIGGRIRTSHTAFPGSACEYGGEFIDSNHTDLWALIRDLELDVVDIKSGNEALLRRTFLIDGRRYTELDLAKALTHTVTQIDREEQTLELPFRGRCSRQAWARDHLSLEEYLGRLPIDTWVRKLLDVVYTTEFGLDTGEQSSLNLAFILRSGPAKDIHFYGDSDERFRLPDGNSEIIEGLVRRLDRPVAVGHRLVRVSDSPHGYRLVFHTDGGTVEKQVDYLILAIPYSTLRHVELQLVLPPDQRRAIRELGYGENAKAMLGVKHRFWRSEHMSGESVSDLDIQTTWDGSRGSKSVGGFITCYLGGVRGRRIGDGSSIDHASSCLQRVFGTWHDQATGAGHVIGWRNNPWSQGSYSCYKVGQYSRLRGFENLSSRGLFFAGEHCSLKSKGFMNGAAESGRLAAQAIVKKIRS